jgi:hypothetical protein
MLPKKRIKVHELSQTEWIGMTSAEAVASGGGVIAGGTVANLQLIGAVGWCRVGECHGINWSSSGWIVFSWHSLGW